MVNEAREFGIRLILTLTDSQGDYGGMAQYVRWTGPLTETIRDFYTNKKIRVRRASCISSARSCWSCADMATSSSISRILHGLDVWLPPGARQQGTLSTTPNHCNAGCLLQMDVTSDTHWKPP